MLIVAERDHQVVLDGTHNTVTITDRSRCQGHWGRLSFRRTETRIGSGNPADVFEQTVTFNRLGNLESITYHGSTSGGSHGEGNSSVPTGASVTSARARSWSSWYR